MNVLSKMIQVDWQNTDSVEVVRQVFADAAEYLKRVERHIYKGNEIRSDAWMDYSEKQEEIKRLDQKRTEAHNKMLVSAAGLIDLLDADTEFRRSDYKLENRSQIADFIALIAFEIVGLEPSSTIEGNVRDELAERIHDGTITKEMINNKIKEYRKQN